MDLRNRKYYLVRQTDGLQNIIEELKHYYPVNMKSGSYLFGKTYEQPSYLFNGLYRHKVSIKKEYIKHFEFFMNKNKIQYLEITTDPIVKHTPLGIDYIWVNDLEEALTALNLNYDDYKKIAKFINQLKMENKK